MTTNQPSNAPPPGSDARDRETVAAVMNDETLDHIPGGGGLGGASAAVPREPGAGTGPAPNAPISPPTGNMLTDAAVAEAEARVQALGSDHAGEPHGSSQ